MIHDGGKFRGWEHGGFYGDVQEVLGVKLNVLNRRGTDVSAFYIGQIGDMPAMCLTKCG